MYKFSKKSLDKLTSADFRLEFLMKEVIKYIDVSILDSYRTSEKQRELYNAGKSKLLESKHNLYPAQAIDVSPYPYPKGEKEIRQAYYLAGFIKATAIRLGIDIIIGCDWNDDGDIRTDNFQDVWHIELTYKKGGLL
jgi:peptidoglycan LD-endopeptidase CwlK